MTTQTENPTQFFLSKLQGVKERHGGWMAKCPAHDDNKASLSVKEGSDGRCLIHCHAGCDAESIMRAVGLELKHMYPGKQVGSKPISGKNKIVARYSYTDVNGKLLYEVVRFEPKTFRQRVPNGNGGWSWSMNGQTRVLFGLTNIKKAIDNDIPVIIVEGEKDVISLGNHFGFVATCNPGGAGKWLASYNKLLDGASVIILPDNDEPGRKHAELVAQHLQGHAKQVKVIELPGLPEKGDVTDWIESGGTKEELSKLAEDTPEWEPTPISLSPTGTSEAGDGVGTSEHEYNDDESQLANAQMLIETHGDKMRYNVDLGAWYVYDGMRWAEDKTGVVRRLAAKIVDSLYAKLPDYTGGDPKDLLKHILKSKKDSEINGMLNLAKDAVSDTIPVRQEAFDQNPMLFNCENVTIDLETGQTRPHNRQDMLSKLSDVVYDPAAECPRWLQFLDEVFPDEYGNPDTETIKYMQRLSGYYMTGLTREQKIWMLYGKGAAGKGKFCEAISNVLGEYSAPVLRSAILEKPAGASGSDNQNLTDVVGNRLIHCSEFDKQDKLDRGLVKAISGEDTLKMRRHCQHAFSFRPLYKLLLLTNHIPSFDGAESGMKRRIVIIPFLSKFYPEEDGLSPIADKHLSEKLKAEKSGILNWMLAGLREYLEQDGFGKTPQAIRQASADVLSDLDLLSDWLTDNCNEGRKYSESLQELWTDYSAWCTDNNRLPGFRDSRSFNKNLTARDGVTKYRVAGGMGIQGISLKTSTDNVDNVDKRQILISPHERENIETDKETGHYLHYLHSDPEKDTQPTGNVDRSELIPVNANPADISKDTQPDPDNGKPGVCSCGQPITWHIDPKKRFRLLSHCNACGHDAVIPVNEYDLYVKKLQKDGKLK